MLLRRDGFTFPEGRMMLRKHVISSGSDIEPDGGVFSRFARRSISRNASMFLTECGCSEKWKCFVVVIFFGFSKYRRPQEPGTEAL